jgi:cell division protein FtsA
VEFHRRKAGSLIGKGRRITKQDIEKINRLVRVSDLPPARQVIGVAPLEYFADGAPVPGEPLGMHCSRLEMESFIITADSSFIESLIEAVYKSGVRIRDLLPSTMAAGEILLESARLHLGAALIEIGGSCTGILVYNRGLPLGFEVIPIGSDHITSDLAICMRTTLEGAEEVKRNIGLGIDEKEKKGEKENNSPEGDVAVPRLSGSGFNMVPAKTARSIIEARVCEILDLAGSSVSRLAGGVELPGGLVLAGGGSLLKGLAPFASQYLGAEVRSGFPAAHLQCAFREEKVDLDLTTAGAFGLLKYFFKNYCGVQPEDQPAAGLRNIMKRFFRAPK